MSTPEMAETFSFFCIRILLPFELIQKQGCSIPFNIGKELHPVAANQ